MYGNIVGIRIEVMPIIEETQHIRLCIYPVRLACVGEVGGLILHGAYVLPVDTDVRCTRAVTIEAFGL